MKAETAWIRCRRFPSFSSSTVIKAFLRGSQAIGGMDGMVKSLLSSGSGINSTSSGRVGTVPFIPAMQRSGWSKMFPLWSAYSILGKRRATVVLLITWINPEGSVGRKIPHFMRRRNAVNFSVASHYLMVVPEGKIRKNVQTWYIHGKAWL